MTTRALAFSIAIVACMGFVILLAVEPVSGAPYAPCRVPPVVGVGTKPNVMLVMDYSGSMQFPAYFDDHYDGYYDSKVADCYDTGTSQIYVASNQYYGSFDPDTYYLYDSTNHYFFAANPQPVLYYQGTSNSADGGGGTIEFTCDNHNFQAGDLVVLYDLSSHKGLNGDGHTVVSVSGNKFKINGTWNGKADAKGYKAIKRITGDTSIGIGGNILNLATTSRMDAALKALIGGKALCPDGDSNCYVQSQGSRRYVSESTNVFADFYVRPATLQNPVQTYPDNYSTGTYSSKDIFVTIFGQFRGTMDANDPVVWDQSTEPWTFTITRTTRVIVKLKGSWNNARGSRIAVYPHANFDTNNSWSAESHSTTSATITLSADLTAGTYWVRIAPVVQLGAGEFPTRYVVWSNVDLTKYTGLHANPSNHNGTISTKIGTLPWARARIKVPKEERKGLVQDAFSFVRFGFMYFKGDLKANKGKILVGCHNDDMNRLINALEGRDTDSGDGLDFTQAFPYYGTPTGPALEEVYDYFNQHSNSDNADNSLFVSSTTKGKVVDPFYSLDASGTARAVPCRKSFALLVSDGVWNDGTDPVRPAVRIHRDDLRPDSQNPALPGDQLVDIYSIFAFSQELEGKNSMKAVAMYGAYKKKKGCGDDDFPYPMSDTPSNSKNFTWPVAECDPNGTYNVGCCAEWDSVWDRDQDGTNEQKGIPDAYFEANNGKELHAALAAVLAEVVSKTASAGAVATVSQELSTGDIIIRGVFDAADPEVVDKYLWYGHLEAYWPFEYQGEEKYDFEIPCNKGLICLDIPATSSGCPSLDRHCWDSGKVLSVDQEYSATGDPSRTLFTYRNGVKKSFTWTGNSDGITRDDLRVSTDAEAQNLIKWVHGAEISGKRERDYSKIGNKQWILGDVVYSTPVVVGPPRLGDVSRRDPDVDRFLNFRNGKLNRDKVVYVGANDGMLHAFLLAKYREVTRADGVKENKWISNPAEDPDTTGPAIGEELWAYIPSNLLSELKHLADTNYGVGTCKHRNMVDLSSRAWEVFIKSSQCPSHDTNPQETDEKGRCWRSVVVGGERGGGDMYFAIDITDPHNPQVLWEYAVFKNRIVVDGQTSTDAQCLQNCQIACNTKPECQTIYDDCVVANNCYSLSTQRKRDGCIAKCKNKAKDECVNPCQTACTDQCSSVVYKSFMPFNDPARYESIKMIPMSWSQPYLGRIRIPDGVKFYVGPPTYAGDLIDGGYPQNLLLFGGSGGASLPANPIFPATLHNNRSVAVMGGGIRIFDADFDVPGFGAAQLRLKTTLFQPSLIMMDIETGYNLLEYVWPMVVNKNSEYFLPVTMDTSTIPYAMSDPLALDLWDQETDSIGDDGFIDRVYVGDLNGYFYGIKFNLDPQVTGPSGTKVTNKHFGMQVDLWPTKSIDTEDLLTNYYRGSRQPINVQPVATFEKQSNAIHVIFGTGKYDDVFTGHDDKADTAKMALYNIRDIVELPDLSGGTYEVFDTSHQTGFKVKFNQKCPGVAFNSGCTWMRQGSSPADGDCCQSSTGGSPSCSSPCFDCIFDLTLPTATNKAGERIVGKPLIAGGLAFVTSFVPPDDPCDFSGQGYLYVFNANCTPLGDERTIFPSASDAALAFLGFGPENNRVEYGIQLNLGRGMPSRPVLDSRGENVIVQMSDGTLTRTAVNLPGKPLQVKGWRSTR